MLKKIKEFLLDMLFAPSGTALLAFCVMLLISIFNLLNTTLFLGSNATMLLFIPLAFGVPTFFFWLSRGGRKYIPTQHLELPKKIHIPTILFSSLVLCLGSTLINLIFIDGKYTDFSLYNAFFASRNGNIFNDLYLVLAFCIVPPIFEGLVFRGIFITENERRGRLATTLFSALFFALLSFDAPIFPQRFFMGALLCIVLFATESIATTVALHVLYNFYAVFVEPTFIALKNVSSNFALFAYGWAILTLVAIFFLLSHLSRLYRKYSHDKFGESFVRSTPRERTFWHLVELSLSIPAIACYVLYIIVTLIIGI